ncbi:MAG: hypothetical protein IPN89_13320 [Saprospiraceae bacterium]|nr:hypothetical protein [Saprospiraceae bacterium]
MVCKDGGQEPQLTTKHSSCQADEALLCFISLWLKRSVIIVAYSATARKLGVIIWNMVTHGTNYINPAGYLFLDQKRKLGIVKRIQKQIDKFGLTNDDVVFTTV